ncbi:MAG: hypothetical protein QNJ67_09780 [Kiloniellales bacterium]|nr:hypothetical protein [Kiloniellales bacterium]
MTRLSPLAAGLFLALLLAGCANQPFPVAPSSDAREALPPEASQEIVLGTFDYDPRPRAVAVCYGSLFNRPKQVMAEAQRLCPNGGRLERVGQDAFWNGCALMLPIRASFVCFPGPEPERAGLPATSPE